MWLQNIWSFFKRYKMESVFFRNFSVTLIILLGIMFSWASYVNERMKIEWENALLSSAAGYSSAFDAMYSEMRLLTGTLANNKNVAAFARTNSVELPGYDAYVLDDLLVSTGVTYPYIDSVYIYSAESGYVASLGSNSQLSDFYDNAWHINYLYLTKNRIEVLLRNTESADGLPEVISFIAPVYSANDKNLGAVVVNVSVRDVSKRLFTAESLREMKVYNQYERLIFSHVEGGGLTAKQEYTLLHGTLKYVFTADISSQNALAANYLITLIILSLLAVVAAFSVMLLITKPLRIIMKETEMNFTPNGIKTKDEIEFIVTKIRNAARRQDDIQKVLEEKMQALNRSYSVALQSQISPHFLYNTLETVNLLAYNNYNGDNQISQIITSLSRLLQISLDSEHMLVSLEQELNHTELFMGILECRYPKNCRFDVDVPPELNGFMVVKLTLQPLVENAFMHGIRKRNGPTEKVIRISAAEDGDKLLITVKDNGAGMPPDKLAQIREALAACDVSLASEAIGLNNVNQRIKLLFGDDFGLTVDSEEGVGTEVTVTIPKVIF